MNLSIPSGFDIFGWEVSYYGIISALAYLLGVVMACVFAKKRGFKVDDIITLACYVIPLAVVGARLYYVLFRLEYYTNFVDVLKIWEGGLGFYGGLIGGVLGVVLYCLIHKKKFFALTDIIVPALILSQALGRWGNFFNQEAYGNPVTNPNLQWFPFAVFIEDVGQWHMATFFYESMWNLFSFAILTTLLLKIRFRQNGIVASYYLILYGIGRIYIEGLRTDSLYLGSIRISQLLSAVFVVIGLAIIIWKTIENKKKTDNFDKIMSVFKTDL